MDKFHRNFSPEFIRIKRLDRISAKLHYQYRKKHNADLERPVWHALVVNGTCGANYDGPVKEQCRIENTHQKALKKITGMVYPLRHFVFIVYLRFFKDIINTYRHQNRTADYACVNFIGRRDNEILGTKKYSADKHHVA